MKELNLSFFHLELGAKAIVIGERIKGGTFRPCIETLPSSTLKGSFRDHFGLLDVSAIGFFREGTYVRDIFTYAPFDALLGSSKIPISTEYIKPSNNQEAIIADIYIVKKEQTNDLVRVLPLEGFMGALKSKGFGRYKLKYVSEIKPNVKIGYLKGRLFEEECTQFGITHIVKPCYGYLFHPTSKVSGLYKRALFEGSIIEGPEFLISEEYKYDY